MLINFNLQSINITKNIVEWKNTLAYIENCMLPCEQIGFKMNSHPAYNFDITDIIWVKIHTFKITSKLVLMTYIVIRIQI